MLHKNVDKSTMELKTLNKIQESNKIVSFYLTESSWKNKNYRYRKLADIFGFRISKGFILVAPLCQTFLFDKY